MQDLEAASERGGFTLLLFPWAVLRSSVVLEMDTDLWAPVWSLASWVSRGSWDISGYFWSLEQSYGLQSLHSVVPLCKSPFYSSFYLSEHLIPILNPFLFKIPIEVSIISTELWKICKLLHKLIQRICFFPTKLALIEAGRISRKCHWNKESP